ARKLTADRQSALPSGGYVPQVNRPAPAYSRKRRSVGGESDAGIIGERDIEDGDLSLGRQVPETDFSVFPADRAEPLPGGRHRECGPAPLVSGPELAADRRRGNVPNCERRATSARHQSVRAGEDQTSDVVPLGVACPQRLPRSRVADGQLAV